MGIKLPDGFEPSDNVLKPQPDERIETKHAFGWMFGQVGLLIVAPSEAGSFSVTMYSS